MSIVLAASGPSPLWYLNRAAGVVALLLLTTSMLLGIVDVSRWSSKRWPRFVVDGLHRNVSILALGVVVAHIIFVVTDSFAPIGLTDAVIPFVSPYRPLWLGFGALAFDLLVAVSLTSMVRGHLGHRTWRAVHWAAYGCWPFAILHGLGTGTDTPLAWNLALTSACVLAVVVAIARRVAVGLPEHSGVRVLANGALLAGVVALVVWVSAGPLGGNWARRAGTPVTLIASAQPASASIPGSTLNPPFSARLAGSIRQSAASGGLVTVDLPMEMSGGASGAIDVRITGTAIAGGGVTMTQGSVSLGPPQQPALYSGRVTALQGQTILGTVSSGNGSPIQVRIDISIDQAAQTVSGTLSSV